MTKSQKNEIDFLEKYFVKGVVSDQEKKDYILKTVHGKDVNDNPLMFAKWNLDITVKQWMKDVVDGLFTPYEIVDEFYVREDLHPHAEKIVSMLIKELNRKGHSETYIKNRKALSDIIWRHYKEMRS